jgi:DNA-binding transcriptional LysR family regulator
MVAALPHTHRLARRTRLSLGDLSEEAFVLFPRSGRPALYDDIIAQCRSAGFSPRVVQEAAGWHTLAGLVVAAVGVAFVPRSLARLQRPGVVYRPVRDLTVEMQMSAAWKRGEKSPVRERFVIALRAVAHARPRSGRGAGAEAETRRRNRR